MKNDDSDIFTSSEITLRKNILKITKVCGFIGF